MRKLKSEGAPENDVKMAVTELKARKKVLEDKVSVFYFPNKKSYNQGICNETGLPCPRYRYFFPVNIRIFKILTRDIV